MTVGAAERPQAGITPAEWVPYAAVVALLLVELVAIVALNDGALVYSLDDPYIHLAVAENIARGHYGINLAEPSAPSSSILWPVLLVPFSGTEIHDEWPLMLNIAAALASVGVLQAIVRRALPSETAPFTWLRPLLVVLAAVLFNFGGLVFTGMEHSLQVLLALTVVLGLVIEGEERRVPWFLVAAVLLGPALRYENLGLSGAAVAFLGLRGRITAAGMLGLLALLPVIGFSLFLRDLGLGWLPSSVVLKTRLASGDATLPEIGAAFVRSWLDSPGLYSRLLLLGMAALFARRALRPETDSAARPLALAGLTMVAAHLVAGKYGWFGRYEVYVMSSGAALCLYLYRDAVSAWLSVQSPAKAGAAAVAIGLLLGLPTARATLLTPLAANNVYEQQYQMHRFVTEYADGVPVAVNDIGWVSYRNDGHVLDLWGLGSAEAGARRLAAEPGWIDDMAARFSVRLAILYDDWFDGQIPSHWRRMGTLHLGRSRVTPASREVAFYVTDAAAASAFGPRLVEFSRTLPKGVVFEPEQSLRRTFTNP